MWRSLLQRKDSKENMKKIAKKNSKRKVPTDFFSDFVKELNKRTHVDGDEGRGIAKASVVGRMQDVLNGEKKKTHDPNPK